LFKFNGCHDGAYHIKEEKEADNQTKNKHGKLRLCCAFRCGDYSKLVKLCKLFLQFICVQRIRGSACANSTVQVECKQVNLHIVAFHLSVFVLYYL